MENIGRYVNDAKNDILSGTLCRWNEKRFESFQEFIADRLISQVLKRSNTAFFNSCYAKLSSLKTLCMTPAPPDLMDLSMVESDAFVAEVKSCEAFFKHSVVVIKEMPLMQNLPKDLLLELLMKNFFGVLLIMSPMCYDKASDFVFIRLQSDESADGYVTAYLDLEEFSGLLFSSVMSLITKGSVPSCAATSSGFLAPKQFCEMLRRFDVTMQETYKELSIEASLAMVGLYLLSSARVTVDLKYQRLVRECADIYRDLLNYQLLQMSYGVPACDYVSLHTKIHLLLGDIKYLDLCHSYAARAVPRDSLGPLLRELLDD